MWAWLSNLFSSAASEGAAGATAGEAAGSAAAGASAGSSAGGLVAGEAGSGLGFGAGEAATGAQGAMAAGEAAAAKSGPIAGQEGNIMSEIGGGAGDDSAAARSQQTPSKGFGAQISDFGRSMVKNSDAYKAGESAGQLISNVKNSKFKGVADNITNMSGTMNRGRKGMSENQQNSQPWADPYFIGLMQGR